MFHKVSESGFGISQLKATERDLCGFFVLVVFLLIVVWACVVVRQFYRAGFSPGRWGLTACLSMSVWVKGMGFISPLANISAWSAK